MKLNNIQLDALKELGNIGSAHAATALSKLIHKNIAIDIPVTDIIHRDHLLPANRKKVFICIEFVIFGEIPGKNLFFLEKKEGFKLIDTLIPGVRQKDSDELDETTRSTIQEVASILTANYLGAMGEMINLLFIPSEPNFHIVTMNELSNKIFANFEGIGKNALVIKTTLCDQDLKFSPFFILVPYEDGINIILNKLGLV